MGCRQVARHGVLDPAFGGSNPPTPANVMGMKKVIVQDDIAR
jgi:hypothetical protein